MATTRQTEAKQNSANTFAVPKRRTLTVKLGGEVFHVKVPKMYKVAGMMKMAGRISELQDVGQGDMDSAKAEEMSTAMDEVMGMVTGLFSDTDGTARSGSSRARFLARLEDDDDDLDLDVAGFLIQRVVEAASEGRGQTFPT